MNLELLEGRKVKAEEDKEDRIKAQMAIIADKADAQVAALPNQDVRALNRARDRAAGARTPSAPVVDLEADPDKLFVKCTACIK